MPVPPVIQLQISASDGTKIVVTDNTPQFHSVVVSPAAPTVTVTSLPTSVTASIAYPYTASVVHISQSNSTQLKAIVVEPPAPTKVLTINQNVVDLARFAPSSSLAETASVARVMDFTGLRNSPTLFSSSAQVTYGQLIGIPSDIFRTSLNSSSDITEGTKLFYTDARVKTKLNADGILSSSAQVNFNSLANLPNDIFRYSTNTTTLLLEGTKLFYTDARVKSYLNSLGVVSGSGQVLYTDLVGTPLDIFRTGSHSTTDITEGSKLFYSDVRVRALLDSIGAHSGSTVVSYSTLSGIPADLFKTGSHSTSNITEGTNLFYTDARVKNKLNADTVVSASAQILAVVTGSGVIAYTNLSNVPADIFRTGSHSTTNITEGTNLFYTPSRVKTTLDANGVVSSSAQINAVLNLNGVISSSAQIKTTLNAQNVVSSSAQVTYAGLSGIPADIFQYTTHSTSNIAEGSKLFYTDPRVKTKLNVENVVSSSAQIVYSGISQIPNDIFLWSLNNTSVITEGTNLWYTDARVKLKLNVEGVVSSSAQINYTGLTNVPVDIFRTGSHSTTNITEGSNLFYTDARVKTKLNAESVVTSSNQIDFLSVSNVPTLVSSSGQIIYSGISAIPADLFKTGSHSTTNITEGTNLFYTDVRVKNKLNADGVISSSNQVTVPASRVTAGSFPVGTFVFTSASLVGIGVTPTEVLHVSGNLRVEGAVTSSNRILAQNGLTVSAGTVVLPNASISDSALSSNVVLENVANVFLTAQAIQSASTTDYVLFTRVTGDAANRFGVRTDGFIDWGSGTGGRDTNLYRAASNTLRTDSTFYVGGNLVSTGSFTANGTATIGGFLFNLVGDAGGIYGQSGGSAAIEFSGAGVSRIYFNTGSGFTLLERGGSDRIAVTTTGVGVGTLSPARAFHVAGSARFAGSVVELSNSGRLYFTLNSPSHSIGYSNANNADGPSIDGNTVDLTIAGTNKVRITPTGVGVGVLSPSASFHVGNNARIDGALTASIVSASTLITSNVTASVFNENGVNLDQKYLLQSGGTVTGNLIVSGAVTAQSFNTQIVSSSIVYQSGSTKFGDTADDVMSVTGSVVVSGNITATGTITGNITGSSTTSITSSYAATASTVPYTGVTGKPTLVSSSAQVDFTGIINKPTLVSSSAQISYPSIANIPADLFKTGSHTTTNITEGSNLFYTDVRVKTKLNTDGVVSSSGQISYAGLSNVPLDIFRYSSNTTSQIIEGTNLFYTDVRVKNKMNSDAVVSSSIQVDFNGIANKPTLVSSSAQVDFNTISNKPALVSASAQITYAGLTGVPADIFRTGSHSTTNITEGTNLFYTDPRVKTKMNTDGVISSSAQVTYGGLSGIPVDIFRTGSHSTTNITEGSNLFYTDVRVKNKMNTDGVVSSSAQVNYSGLTGIPADLFKTGSMTTTNITEGTNLYYTDVRVKTKMGLDGVFSSSAQVQASGITGTVSDASLSSNVPLKNGSNIFTNANTFNNAVFVNQSASVYWAGFPTATAGSGSGIVFRKDGTRHVGMRWNGSVLDILDASASGGVLDAWTGVPFVTFDVVNKRLGIGTGTTTPGAALYVSGSTTFAPAVIPTTSSAAEIFVYRDTGTPNELGFMLGGGGQTFAVRNGVGALRFDAQTGLTIKGSQVFVSGAVTTNSSITTTGGITVNSGVLTFSGSGGVSGQQIGSSGTAGMNYSVAATGIHSWYSAGTQLASLNSLGTWTAGTGSYTNAVLAPTGSFSGQLKANVRNVGLVDVVTHTSINSPNNTFGSAGVHIPEVHDVLYSADTRFIVSGSNFASTNYSTLFTNEYLGNVTIQSQSAAVLTVTMNSGSEWNNSGSVYPDGYIQVTYYNANTPASASLRVNRNSPSGWSAPITPINTGTGPTGVVHRFALPGNNYLTDLEFSWTAQDTIFTQVQSIQYVKTRTEGLPQASFNKSKANSLHGNTFWRDGTNVIRSQVQTTGAAWFSGSVNVGGMFVSGALTVSGSSIFNGNGTFNGTATTVSSSISINDVAGTSRVVWFRTAGSNRWALVANTGVESGGNVGSSFNLNAYDDSGVFIDTPIGIARGVGGSISLTRPIVINGASTVNGNLTVTGSNSSVSGSLTINNTASGAQRRLNFTTNNTLRWGMVVNQTAETGGNAGSDFQMTAYDDTGAVIDTIWAVNRVAGSAIQFNRSFNVFGNSVVNGTFTATGSSTHGSNTAVSHTIWSSNPYVATFRRDVNSLTAAIGTQFNALDSAAGNVTYGALVARVEQSASSAHYGQMWIQTTNNGTIADKWGVVGVGHLLAATDNVFDIGNAGSNRPRNLYVAGTGNFGGQIVLSGSLAGLGPATRYIGHGGSPAHLYLNASGSGQVILASGEVSLLSIGASQANINVPLFIGGTLTANGASAAFGATGLSSVNLTLNANTGSFKGLTYLSNGSNRWSAFVNGTESTGNVGANFSLSAYDDTGAIIDTPLAINRVAGGQISLGRPVAVNNIMTVGGNLTFTSDNVYDIGALGSGRVHSVFAGTAMWTPAVGGVSGAQLTLYSNGSGRWIIDTSGNLVGAADNTYDIGISGNSRPRSIYVGTNITAGGTVNAASIVETSTLRRKKDIITQERQMDNVMKLRPVEFTWKDSEKRDKGLIAEEVAEIYPEFVAFETVEGETVPAAVNYSKMVAVLIQTVQELNERVAELEKQEKPGFWKSLKSRFSKKS